MGYTLLPISPTTGSSSGYLLLPRIPVSGGGSGGSGEVVKAEFVAGQVISALRVVKGSAAGTVVYASSDNQAQADLPIGISLTAGGIGDTIEVVLSGKLEDVGWSWDTTKPVFLGVNGVLTQVATASGGFSQIIGTPISPTVLDVNIQPSIKV